MDQVFSKQVLDTLYSNHAKKIRVYLRSAYTKGSNYDPFRDTGEVKTLTNPWTIKGIIRQVAPNSLIIREMGLAEVGAIQIIVRNSDLNFLKQADKIEYNNEEYYLYHDAVGSKVQIFDVAFNYSKVIMFKRNL